jgi:hypothetical protein
LVIVLGNLTVSQGLTFDGLSSQIVVNGCVILGDNQVTIELTEEELQQLARQGLTKTLLTATASECEGSTDFTGTKITVNSNSKAQKCKKVKALNSGSTSSSLVVAFSLDSSSCNTKWIILGSVLGGAIVLAVIAMVLLVTFNKKVRECVRPYSKVQRRTTTRG